MPAFSTQYTTALNNVTVSVDGRSFSTVTDSLGNYVLSHLPQSVYDLSFIKPGAAISKKQQIICPNSGTHYVNASTYDLPTSIFKDGYIKDTTSNPTVKIRLYYDSQPYPIQFIVVYGKTNKVDLGNPDTYDDFFYKVFANTPNEKTCIYFFDYRVEFKKKYPSGTVFYARVYPVSTAEYGYFDYVKNKSVFTGYGTPLLGTFSLTMRYY